MSYEFIDDGNVPPGSAWQMVETASAFARREMLPEARQALQRARSTLAERNDVGPAHWCNACLVALEIAARGGDVRGMEAEAAQLHTLSMGGQYWAEQARARIAGSAGRVDQERLDRVFAVLAGTALPDSDALHPSSACAEGSGPTGLAPSLGAPELPMHPAQMDPDPVSRSEPPFHNAPDAGGPVPRAPLVTVAEASVAPHNSPVHAVSVAPHIPLAHEASATPHILPAHEASATPHTPSEREAPAASALAAEVATSERTPAVALAERAAETPGAALRPAATVPAALPAAPLVVAERALGGLPMSDFTTAPQRMELAAPRGMAPSPLALAAAPAPSCEPAEPLPLLEARRDGGVLRGIMVLALVACAAWMYMPLATKQSLAVPGFALFRATSAEGEEAPRGHLARGQALLATGDTAGAVAAFAAAAQGDSRGAIAWAAAEALARLPGRAAPAADAYLLAFAAGLPPDRAEIVAHAQELAGHPDRARRVREQAGR